MTTIALVVLLAWAATGAVCDGHLTEPAGEIEWIQPALVETLAKADAWLAAEQPPASVQPRPAAAVTTPRPAAPRPAAPRPAAPPVVAPRAAPGTVTTGGQQTWAEWAGNKINTFAESRHIGGPGEQSWTDFNDPAKCRRLRVSGRNGFVGSPGAISLPAATIERATKGVPALTAKSVGTAVFNEYINRACGPSSDYRGLTMMGYDMPRIAGSLGQWLQKHPYLFGVMGNIPRKINDWINTQPGLVGATKMGPVYTSLSAWVASVQPEIRAGRPVLCLLGFTAAGMHYVNVVGFRYANGQLVEVAVLDPNQPAQVKLVAKTMWDQLMRGPLYVPGMALGATTIFYNPNAHPITTPPVMPPPVQQ